MESLSQKLGELVPEIRRACVGNVERFSKKLEELSEATTKFFPMVKKLEPEA